MKVLIFFLLFSCAVNSQSCGENEVYSECGSACPDNCLNIMRNIMIKCISLCVPGCVCADGYVRQSTSTNSVCVPRDTCNNLYCHKQIEVGPCKGAFTRWGYDASSQSCIMFSYGGCEGNENRFSTEEECNTACAKYIK